MYNLINIYINIDIYINVIVYSIYAWFLELTVSLWRATYLSSLPSLAPFASMSQAKTHAEQKVCNRALRIEISSLQYSQHLKKRAAQE